MGIAIASMTKYALGKHIYGIDPASLPELVPSYLRVSVPQPFIIAEFLC